MPARPPAVLLLREHEVRGLISVDDSLQAARDAFVQLALGKVTLLGELSLELPEQHGDMHVKGAYVHNGPYYSVKVASGFYDNPGVGLPVGSGAVWLFDANTGFLRAILFDNGFLTALRTGAAGAFAASLLARPSADSVAIIGAGEQARYQLAALAASRELRRAVVWARRRTEAEAYAAEMSELISIPVEVANSPEEAVAEAGIVVTATPSRTPIVHAEWVRPGTHVTAVGSDLPGKVELEPRLLARATVVADLLDQCLRNGEIAAAIEAGAIDAGHVHGELGEIASGQRYGRESDEEITVADLTGVGALDAAVANLVASRAIEAHVGEQLLV